MSDYYHYHKRTKWGSKIIILIIFILLIGYFTNAFDGIKEVKEIKDKVKEKVSNIEWKTSTIQKPIKNELQEKKVEDGLMVNCEQDFNYYLDISRKKSGLSIEHLKTQKVNNQEEADEFYELWSIPLGLLTANPDAKNIDTFPVVMFAIRVDHPDGTAFPYVIVCENNGELTKYSRQIMLS